ncbi:NADH:flavin oxidoreductase [uncultured Apibacter sp.]|uniref:NADH:flavin oxidoreductase n=1 Tax=uncultured Apibacter sp. TaxID=1778616 RepID=UPI0025D4F835|nr:NADH:flavin oxidoreductase [uncultured Apibacter sp.]
MKIYKLFEPFNYKNLFLKNRIVMAPMTRSFAYNGIPTKEIAEYYERRAQSEVGLIITEGTVVDRSSSSNDLNIPKFYGDEALEGWKRVVDAVHAKDGKIAPQIWHMGIIPPKRNWRPHKPFEGPSGLLNPDTEGGKQMSEDDIKETIDAFAEAAYQAKKIGFDSLELHGAHGYLIDQFFWDKLNRRKDKWGGSTISQRSRFAIEIVKAVRSAVGAEFPIILRLSQWKQQDYSAKIAKSPEEMKEWLLPLSEAGVDIFHCSQRRFWEPEFENSNLNFAGWAKKITGKPSISVGSVALNGDFLGAFRGESFDVNSSFLDELDRRMDQDEFNLIAVGRALLEDPEWVLKIKKGNLSELKGFSKDRLKKLF